MPGIIQGLVTNIVNGDTFDLKVTQVENSQKTPYGKSARIKIISNGTLNSSEIEAYEAKKDLEHAIFDKEVRCHIQSTDEYDIILARVELVQTFNTLFDDY